MGRHPMGHRVLHYILLHDETGKLLAKYKFDRDGKVVLIGSCHRKEKRDFIFGGQRVRKSIKSENTSINELTLDKISSNSSSKSIVAEKIDYKEKEKENKMDIVDQSKVEIPCITQFLDFHRSSAIDVINFLQKFN